MQIEGQLIPPTITPFASQSWELIRLWLHRRAMGWGSLTAVQSLGRTEPRLMHRSSPPGLQLISKHSQHQMLQQKEQPPPNMPNYTALLLQE